ncbi:MAG: EamA family transporter [Nitrospirae bacterium]|nr:MAG: EamA family transporter [Nitrospirota bacterium]
MNDPGADKISRRGYFYVMLAAVFWAVSGSSAKFLFNQGVTAYELVQLRVTIASVLVFFWLIVFKRSLLRIQKKDILYFFVLGGICLASVQFTYLFTISKINVAAAILMQYLSPILIALYSVIFAREKLSATFVIALIGATLGCYLIVGAYNMSMLSLNLAGIIGGLLAAATFAWYSIQGEYGMIRYDPWTVLFFSLLFAALSWNIITPPFGSFFKPHAAVEWLWILYIVVFGTIIPYGLYLKGIHLIHATRASITATLEPITAGILAYLFLGERLEALQLLGAPLIIGSIILLQLKDKNQGNK